MRIRAHPLYRVEVGSSPTRSLMTFITITSALLLIVLMIMLIFGEEE